MKSVDRYLNLILTILFIVAAWCFWSLRYPCALAYQEQLQMFLFDSDYLMERLIVPGGIARYVAEFLVQMYNNVYIGGAILTLLYLLIQQLVWFVGKKECGIKNIGYALSFFPSMSLWYYMGNENMKHTFIIALIFALIAMLLYPSRGTKGRKIIYVLIATPLLYYLAGPTVLVFALYVLAKEIFMSHDWLIACITIAWSVACIIISIPLVAQPTYRLFYGINYSLIIDSFPKMQYAVMLLTAFTPIIIASIRTEVKGLNVKGAMTYLAYLCVIFFCGVIVPLNYPSNKYDVIEYDYLMRAQRWQQIVDKAEKKEAHSPLSAATYNLALGMTGHMGRAMQFTQNGWYGAFPPFNKIYLSSLMTNEIYWHVGLVNTSQRFAFEAMEAIPDNNKSSRIVKRLAETNLVNGQYDVAMKYLRLLQKTMFYGKWANKTMALLDDEEAINNHPLYGTLRQFRLDEDFLFSEGELDKILGHLVMHNVNNNLAIQYLLLLPQLEGNQQKYKMYMDFVQKKLMEE